MEVRPFSAAPALWGRKGVLKTEILYLAVGKSEMVTSQTEGKLLNIVERWHFCGQTQSFISGQDCTSVPFSQKESQLL